ncbi:hypothetical protein NVP1161O_178 [Vibrio phage 1.161.O._10N.261.48.C5]|nr:hypothetical protein NVP1161O_178 [Vibrio phage 1.161.O._10N.261.48.C5]
MKPIREQVIQLLITDEVYESLNLNPFYDKEAGCYPSIYELLGGTWCKCRGN